MKEQIRILSTRKLLPNQKQFLLNAGMSLTETDFIQTAGHNFDLTEINEYLVFTSQNAVNSYLKNPVAMALKVKPCCCVGTKTKELLEQNGFEVVLSASNSAELGQLIIRQFQNSSFSIFGGNLTLKILPEILKTASVTFNELEIYKTELTPCKIDGKFNGILFFSPSGVESFLSINKLQDATCFCIGSTTAKALEHLTLKVIIAHQPTVENTIIQTINHYKKA